MDLTSVPAPGERRVAVRVTPDALRQVRAGHPWLFDRAITSVSHDAAPGDLAVVFDDRRRFAAIGLWDPTSPIRVRILHAGPPTPIDESFWVDRLLTAMVRRDVLVDDPTTTGYRCINGESDGFPGLVLDRYDTTAVVKLYSPAWFPHLATLVPLAADLLATTSVVLRLARSVAAGDTHGTADGTVLHGDAPTADVAFLEHGLAFGADVVHGHKTGFFLDQRDNRVLVGGLAGADAQGGQGGAEMLDVFSSSGGFGVHAAAGGAASVHSVDVAAPALVAARENMVRNLERPEVARCVHTTEAGDAFDVLRAAVAQGRRWDLVVVDPPSFAPRLDAVDRALRAYADLTALGLAVTRPGGVFVQSSCSSRIDADTFHDQVRSVAQARHVRLTELARTAHPIDHPSTFPEARYLKTVFARVEV